jgi:tRNA(Arg) A34 adenosine deaminase TadA
VDVELDVDLDPNADFMEQAARLARRGVERGEGGPFGAVVVCDGVVVGAACNRVLDRSDPTAHAEMEAIREACRHLGRFHLDGCELYSTCEPCPMCLGAIHWAHIDRVLYSQTREEAAAIGFDDARLYAWMQQPRVELVHRRSEAAGSVFRLWEERADRTGY